MDWILSSIAESQLVKGFFCLFGKRKFIIPLRKHANRPCPEPVESSLHPPSTTAVLYRYDKWLPSMQFCDWSVARILSCHAGYMPHPSNFLILSAEQYVASNTSLEQHIKYPVIPLLWYEYSPGLFFYLSLRPSVTVRCYITLHYIILHYITLLIDIEQVKL